MNVFKSNEYISYKHVLSNKLVDYEPPAIINLLLLTNARWLCLGEGGYPLKFTGVKSH